MKWIKEIMEREVDLEASRRCVSKSVSIKQERRREKVTIIRGLFRGIS